MRFAGVYAVLGSALLVAFLIMTPGEYDAWMRAAKSALERIYEGHMPGYAPLMRARDLVVNMLEERRINDELRHGYHWNEEKTVLDVLPDYSVCSFLAHDSALFRLALTLKYDAVVDAVRDRVKALSQDLSVACALGGYEIPQAQKSLLQWRMYLQRVVADAIIEGDVYALESLQRRGEIGDAFPHMPITVLVRAPRDNERLKPWITRFFRHSPLYEALSRSERPSSVLRTA